MFMKKKKITTARGKGTDLIKDLLKEVRKESREAEINAHGKPINKTKVETSPKVYKRNKKVDIEE